MESIDRRQDLGHDRVDPRLELVTTGIDAIVPEGVRTVDGVVREVDAVVLATGYAATKFLTTIDVVGAGGRTIDDAWSQGAQAHLGVTTTGFPNLFMLYGPNMNNGSIIQMIEYQVEYIVDLLGTMVERDLAAIDVQPEAMEMYNVEVQRAIDGIDVWNSNCNTYYRAPNGRVVTQWPYSMEDYRTMTTTIDWAAFDVMTKGTDA